MHYSVGHLLNGTTDPRYICASIREASGNDIWKLTATRSECLLRSAVYSALNRYSYHLTDDFSELCVEPGGQNILHHFTEEMRRFNEEVKRSNAGSEYPRMLVPENITSSASS